MFSIEYHEGIRKDLLNEFETEQWPIADKEHFGDEMPDFTKQKYTILAKEDSQTVGFIKMETDMGVATIHSLLVHNEFQGKGVGTALIKQAEEIAKEKACHMIKLETGKDWHAKPFYESQGFVTVTELKEYYGKRDFVLMEKRLNVSSE